MERPETTRRWWVLRPHRPSLKGLMALILVVGGGLGWFAHLMRTAQVQRDAVAAITRAGGSASYDWQYQGGALRRNGGSILMADEVPGWPNWLVDRLGIDAFGNVVDVSFRGSTANPTREEMGEACARVGRLGRLVHLSFHKMPLVDADLAHLRGLSRLETLMIRGSDEVTDAGLAHLSTLTGLKELYLDRARISDAGLASLRGLAGLEVINLAGTSIGDAGLAELGHLRRVETLVLDGTRVTDVGLARFLAGRSRFKGLYLADTAVGDDGLAPLVGVSGLGWLSLRRTRVTDAGLAHLEGLTGLMVLDLYHTEVGDAGLAHLRSLTGLEHLNLEGTKVTNAGLAELEELAHLRDLRLHDTEVTEAGVVGLRRVLPGLPIEPPNPAARQH